MKDYEEGINCQFEKKLTKMDIKKPPRKRGGKRLRGPAKVALGRMSMKKLCDFKWFT